MKQLLALILIALAAMTVTIAAAPKKPLAGHWSGPVAISPVCQPDPTRGSQMNDIAVNANGLSIAAWDQFTYNNGGPYTIGAAIQSGDKWSAPFTISGSEGFSMSPKVAVGADGTMAVSWIYEDAALTLQRVQVAVKPATSVLWTTATLAQWPAGGVSMTQFAPVAVDNAGNVTAVWLVWDGTRHVAQAATMPKGGGWGQATALSGAPTDALYPSLAVNARGDAAVVYSHSSYAGYITGTYAQFVFRDGPTGAWSQPVIITETLPSNVGYVTGPQVVLDAAGLATVVYFGRGLEGIRQISRSSWASPVALIPPPNPVSYYLSADLGVDSAGNAVVAASMFDATVGVDRASVYVALGAPSGYWSAPQRLTDPAVPVDAYATRVAVSPDGLLAMVGWIDHYHGTVQVSTLNDTTWSAADTIGRGTAFASFQEVLGLDAASGGVARAIWKSTKSGTQTMATSYGR